MKQNILFVLKILDRGLGILHQALDHLFALEKDHVRRFPNKSPFCKETLRDQFDIAKHRIVQFQALLQVVSNTPSCLDIMLNIMQTKKS